MMIFSFTSLPLRCTVAFFARHKTAIKADNLTIVVSTLGQVQLPQTGNVMHVQTSADFCFANPLSNDAIRTCFLVTMLLRRRRWTARQQHFFFVEFGF
jgi:hypothetical protein